MSLAISEDVKFDVEKKQLTYLNLTEDMYDVENKESS